MMLKKIAATAGLLVAALATPALAQVYGPPPARYEPMPPPRPGATFDRGHYRWNGHRYVWVRGRYVAGHGRWVAGHWQHNRYGWRWIDGRWY